MKTSMQWARWLGLAPLLVVCCDCSTYGLGPPPDGSSTSGIAATASTAVVDPGSTGAVEPGSSGAMTDTGGSSGMGGSAEDSGDVCGEVEPVCQRWARDVVDVEGGQGVESHVAIDASGSVVLAGSFSGTIDLGGGALSSASQQDIFIARYTPKGSLDWQRTFATAEPGGVGYLHDVAVSPDGAVHIVGRASHDIDLGGGVEPVTTPDGAWDFFVAEYGADGEFLWSRMFGQTASEIGTDIILDSQDNILVGGLFYGGSLDFGGGAMTSEDNDSFLLKLDSDGGLIWSRQLSGANDQLITGMAVDNSDAVVLVGQFDTALKFTGVDIQSNSGPSAPFLLRADSDSQLLWSISMYSETNDVGYVSGVAVGAQDSIVIGGWFAGTMNIGGSWPVMAANLSPFVARLSLDGDVKWDHVFALGEPFQGEPWTVRLGVAGDDSLWLAMTMTPSIDLGGDLLVARGGEDLVLAKYAAGGTHLWSDRFGDAENQRFDDMAVGADGVAFSGIFKGTLGFLSGNKLQAGGDWPDIFAVKMGDCPVCE